MIMTPQEFKQIRKELNLTQRELANELGLSKNGKVYIMKIETGRSDPSGLLLRALMLLKENKENKENKEIIKKIKKVVDL